MAREGKSINDIERQLKRIEQKGNALTGGNFRTTARGRKAYEAAQRYYGNIINTRGMVTRINGEEFVDSTTKVSRNKYMGNSSH